MGQILSSDDDDYDFDSDDDPDWDPFLQGKRQRKASSPPFVPNKKRRIHWTAGVAASKLVAGVTPHNRCKLRLMKLERIKDHLLLEEEFLSKVQLAVSDDLGREAREVEHLRGRALRVVTLEEMIDNDHAVVSSIFGEMYMPVLSFVDRSLIEPPCSALVNANMSAVVGLLPGERVIGVQRRRT